MTDSQEQRVQEAVERLEEQGSDFGPTVDYNPWPDIRTVLDELKRRGEQIRLLDNRVERLKATNGQTRETLTKLATKVGIYKHHFAAANTRIEELRKALKRIDVLAGTDPLIREECRAALEQSNSEEG